MATAFGTRYVRSADGRESWTPARSYRTTQWDREMRSETVAVTKEFTMKARNDWPCKFDGCGDRTVKAGITEIVKRNGKWGHVECPKQTTWATAPAAAAKIEAGQDISEQDAVDAALAARDAEKRAENLKNLKTGTYRVEFSGRRDTEPFNLKITVDRNNAGSFYFKKAESYDGIGRIWADGRIQLWGTTDKNAPETRNGLKALDILLGSERMGKYGEAYARETGECWRCGRELKLEDSIDRMMGKTCAAKVEAGY